MPILNKILGEINDIYSQEAQKKLIFLKQRYYETGGKSAKYLAYKLRKQQEENTIHKIRNPKTQIIENKIEKIQALRTSIGSCIPNPRRQMRIRLIHFWTP